jgi:hypothetical protein
MPRSLSTKGLYKGGAKCHLHLTAFIGRARKVPIVGGAAESGDGVARWCWWLGQAHANAMLDEVEQALDLLVGAECCGA